MPHHSNEEEHGDEPVRFTDKRKVDPETGEVRGTEDAPAESTDAAGADTGADALAEAERIINEAGDGEDPAEVAAEQAESGSAVETELRNDLLRLQAEYVNYRKRVERDREQTRELAVQSVLNSLLPVLDDLDAARQHGDLEDGPFAAVARKLDTILEGHGLERIAEDGVSFDPTVHEALMQQPNPEVPADHVAQVLRVGYKKGDRVLRAAGVIVSTGE
ncbi:nucleotide exchange factor GrpE [Zhihengliuella flava]|uniref:Protein GrpE n=1 Tax=Zhihengliuella flava TaxID=1285193 RepID=A0A931D5R1_9MICC|nr:nucleotide exchange factor GrpE [Zhihengliuella flava]MBG6084205.1 molecular chaperone GrpE [Zhihengliuella flava]